MSSFNDENPLALRWTGLDPSTVALASLGMNKAKNWDEIQTALKLWDIASQSITYADRQGNIGYRMTGKIPIRSKVNSGHPRVMSAVLPLLTGPGACNRAPHAPSTRRRGLGRARVLEW